MENQLVTKKSLADRVEWGQLGFSFIMSQIPAFGSAAFAYYENVRDSIPADNPITYLPFVLWTAFTTVVTAVCYKMLDGEDP